MYQCQARRGWGVGLFSIIVLESIVYPPSIWQHCTQSPNGMQLYHIVEFATPLSPETSSRYIGQTALFLQYCVPLMLALNSHSQKRKQMFKLHYTIIIIVQRRKIFLFNPATPRMQVNGAELSSKGPLGFGVVVGWVAGYEVVFSEGAGFEPRASEEDALSTPPTPPGL